MTAPKKPKQPAPPSCMVAGIDFGVENEPSKAWLHPPPKVPPPVVPVTADTGPMCGAADGSAPAPQAFIGHLVPSGLLALPGNKAAHLAADLEHPEQFLPLYFLKSDLDKLEEAKLESALEAAKAAPAEVPKHTPSSFPPPAPEEPQEAPKWFPAGGPPGFLFKVGDKVVPAAPFKQSHLSAGFEAAWMDGVGVVEKTGNYGLVSVAWPGEAVPLLFHYANLQHAPPELAPQVLTPVGLAAFVQHPEAEPYPATPMDSAAFVQHLQPHLPVGVSLDELITAVQKALDAPQEKAKTLSMMLAFHANYGGNQGSIETLIKEMAGVPPKEPQQPAATPPAVVDGVYIGTTDPPKLIANAEEFEKTFGPFINSKGQGPGLIKSGIVSVQPMSTPVGAIFYNEFIEPQPPIFAPYVLLQESTAVFKPADDPAPAKKTSILKAAHAKAKAKKEQP